MEYTIRKEALPIIQQTGYHEIKHGISVGKEDRLSNSPIKALHYHQCIELGICCEGSGESHIEDHIYRFRKGDISCVRANTPHLSKADREIECRWIWVFINPFDLPICDSAKLADMLMTATENGFCGVSKPCEHPRLYKLLDDLMQHKKDDKQGFYEKSLLACGIIFEMARIGDADRIDSSRLRFGKLEPAIIYIRENYSDEELMNAANIAESCGLSVSHFRSLFKKHFGMTLPRYINKTRISSDVYLLQNTDKSITQAAFESGFSDVSYFNRLFRREFGISPREMRKKYGAENRAVSEKV